jgi:hypothetical protein
MIDRSTYTVVHIRVVLAGTKVHGVLVFHVGVNPVPEKSHTGVTSRIFWICTAFAANRKYEY